MATTRTFTVRFTDGRNPRTFANATYHFEQAGVLVVELPGGNEKRTRIYSPHAWAEIVDPDTEPALTATHPTPSGIPMPFSQP
ncbi:hypothetical protein [Mycolicibacterium fortuitum]|uniref:hypothetical protein n=1 Tax=Mycolicibacterium fortuitum TaxID=1766 RepID=UPI003AAFB9A3